MTNIYNVELEILTPVIINAGECYQFGELIPSDERAVIKNRDKDLPLPDIYRFHCNDSSNMFGNMDSDSIKRFVDKSTVAISRRDNASLVSLRKELINAIHGDKKMPIRVLGKAKSEISAKPLQQVDKIAQSPFDNAAYIPGSSIKGAIRTGLLEQLRKERGIDHWADLSNDTPSYRRRDFRKQGTKEAKDFEMEVIKNEEASFNILDDPFKYLKVSDFVFSGADALSYIAKVGDDEKMPIYSAMTNSYAYSGKPVVARGTITVDSRFFKDLGSIQDITKVIEKTGDFYLANLNSIRNEITTPLMKYVWNKKFSPMIAGGENAIRLGHYSGIKNYTFDVNQVSPSGRAGVDINMKGGRVVKAEGGVLLGICVMRIVEG